MALIADLIRDCSRRNGLVLDPFGGSGTTLLAAGRTGRVARIIELDPLYVDVAIRRWEQITGLKARHAATGLSVEALGAGRCRSRPAPRARAGANHPVLRCRLSQAAQAHAIQEGPLGNPTGRRKGTLNLATDLADELSERVTPSARTASRAGSASSAPWSSRCWRRPCKAISALPPPCWH